MAVRPSPAFTLIELLTVIAIIGVLATLLMSALASAKRKSRQSYCTSNLRQISLATTMYTDDHEKRPTSLARLVISKFLPNAKSLLCLEDKSGAWGDLVPLGPASLPLLSFSSDLGVSVPMEMEPAFPTSYFTPFKWDDDAWKRLVEQGFLAGLQFRLHLLQVSGFFGREASDLGCVGCGDGVARRRRTAFIRRRHCGCASSRYVHAWNVDRGACGEFRTCETVPVKGRSG